MRTLYQFPLSHFCEKVRWMLDHKELDYIAQNLTPGLHRFKIQYHTGQTDLPVLKDGVEWIAQSTNIALYLDEHYPEHTLIKKDAEIRSKILEIDTLSQELGKYVRQWLFYYLANEKHNSALDVIVGEKGWLKDFDKLSIPAVRLAIKKIYQLNDDSVVVAKERIDAIITELNQCLIENGGRYFIGQRLTLADISVCSMIAPLLLIEGTPWEVDNTLNLADEILINKQLIMQLPLGQYIQRIYDTERNQRVDWRGV